MNLINSDRCGHVGEFAVCDSDGQILSRHWRSPSDRRDDTEQLLAWINRVKKTPVDRALRQRLAAR